MDIDAYIQTLLKAGWSDKPEGWTNKSIKKFSGSLVKGKGPLICCGKEMRIT